jgi:cytochrome c biogenesis protein CcmG/thiol:disulfide interchange protein DsbE
MPSDRAALPRRAVVRALATLGLLGIGVGVHSPLSAASLKRGQPAPPATLNTLDGRKLSTTEYAGKVLILTFWATWCVPCREELPLLSAYAQAHADAGLVVLGFSLDDPGNLAQVRAVAKTLAFPTGLLGSDRLAGYGRIWRIPVNFTIDRQGRLADNGWDEAKPVWTQERLERIVQPLL